MRASTTTKSLPSPFIFRNGRPMGDRYSGSRLDTHPHARQASAMRSIVLAAALSLAAFAASAETPPVTSSAPAAQSAPQATPDAAADPFIWMEE